MNPACIYCGEPVAAFQVPKKRNQLGTYWHGTCKEDADADAQQWRREQARKAGYNFGRYVVGPTILVGFFAMVLWAVLAIW